MLAVTLVVLSLLFLLSFVIFDTDLLAPPTAVALVFLFGCFCTFYNEERWGLEFSPKTTGLIAACILATMVGGIIGVCISRYPKIGKYSFSHEVVLPREIVIQPLKTYLVMAFQLLAFYLIYSHIRRVTGSSGLLSAIGEYRQLTASVTTDVNDPTLKMSFITKNVLQASKMISVVYAYIVGNNLIASKRKISLSWVPVILYSLTTFIQGDRSNMIRLWVVVLIVAYTIHKRAVGWKKSKSTRKMVRRMAISLVVLAALFSGIRGFVGRTSDKDPLYYITFYAGSPIAILDQYWINPIEKPDVFGQKTFYYLNQSLTALIGWPGKYNYYSDFITSPNGTSIGNAPTAIRPTYVEFGFWGFFLLFALFGVFYMVLYCKSRKPSGDNPIDFRLLMYAYIAYVFLMYFYASFLDFLSHLYIKYMVEMLLVRWFLVGKKYKPNIHLFSRGNRNDMESSF